MRFNPAPGWPEPPAGWTPPPGWQPDPAWGAAPSNWAWWVDTGPRRRGARWWIPLAVLTALAMVTGSIISGRMFLTYRHEVQQERAFTAGHIAFLEGNCTTAIRHLGKAVDLGLDRAMELRAVRERDACTDLLAVVARAGKLDPPEAAELYLDYLATPLEPTLDPIAEKAGRAVVRKSKASVLASTTMCRRLDELDSALIAANIRKKVLPELLLVCAAIWTKEQGTQDAIEAYQQIREEFPASKAMKKAVPGYAKARLKLALSEPDVGKDEEPESLGLESQLTRRSEFQLVIQNMGPQPLEVVMQGPVTKLAEVEACKHCRVYSHNARPSCDSAAPTIVVVLPAGKYKTMLDYPIQSRPSVSTWKLRKGNVYFVCYYVANNKKTQVQT